MWGVSEMERESHNLLHIKLSKCFHFLFVVLDEFDLAIQSPTF